MQSRVPTPKYSPQTRQEAEKDNLRKAVAEEEARYNNIVFQITTAIQALAELGRIEEVMTVESFINPDAEQVDDSEEDVFQQIASAHADGD